MNALQKGYDYSSLDDNTRNSVIRHAESIKFRTQRVVEDIIEIGKSLVEVKAQLPHGSFGNWLKSEFDWSEDTAGRFMNVSKRFPQFPATCENLLRKLYIFYRQKKYRTRFARKLYALHRMERKYTKKQSYAHSSIRKLTKKNQSNSARCGI